MKPVALLVMLFTASPAAHGSDFRYCDLQGVVQSAVAHPGGRARDFDFTVLVSAAKPESGKKARTGYTDCSEFVGERIDIRLRLPKRHGEPLAGDTIGFNYSAVDGFDAEGNFAGTSIQASLLSYRSGNTPQKGR